jgi:ribosomal protein S18 acetylase RimI-like enzyme
VAGFCEVDNQPPGTFKISKMVNGNDNSTINNAAGNTIFEEDPREAPRMYHYMCNLAVDRQWKRKGVTKALVNACEDIVLSDEGKGTLHIRFEILCLVV